jgi:hypothetical protein
MVAGWSKFYCLVASHIKYCSDVKEHTTRSLTSIIQWKRSSTSAKVMVFLMWFWYYLWQNLVLDSIPSSLAIPIDNEVVLMISAIWARTLWSVGGMSYQGNQSCIEPKWIIVHRTPLHDQNYFLLWNTVHKTSFSLNESLNNSKWS